MASNEKTRAQLNDLIVEDLSVEEFNTGKDVVLKILILIKIRTSSSKIKMKKTAWRK